MPEVILDNRCIIAFEGPDAEHLLHSVLTCDIENLEPGEARVGALLSPQGKIQFEFFVSKVADSSFRVEIDGQQAAAFKQRMTMYRLRSKVEINESSQRFTKISWEIDSSASSDLLKDTRFKSVAVYRQYLDEGEATDRSEWDTLRIVYGAAEAGLDFELGDAFPHDVSYDQNLGVDFQKGCYIGQEVVSRMHHRKTARRRILIAQASGTFGAEKSIIANDKPVGTLGTIVDGTALALCRIDRVKDAVDKGHAILVGGTKVELSLPPEVTYDWPQEADDG